MVKNLWKNSKLQVISIQSSSHPFSFVVKIQDCLVKINTSKTSVCHLFKTHLLKHAAISLLKVMSTSILCSNQEEQIVKIKVCQIFV